MIYINSIKYNDSLFEIITPANGGDIKKNYPKRYKVEITSSDSVIIRTIENNIALINSVKFDNITIDGVIPKSGLEAQQLLSKIVFQNSNTGGGNGETPLNPIETVVYETPLKHLSLKEDKIVVSEYPEINTPTNSWVSGDIFNYSFNSPIKDASEIINRPMITEIGYGRWIIDSTQDLTQNDGSGMVPTTLTLLMSGYIFLRNIDYDIRYNPNHPVLELRFAKKLISEPGAPKLVYEEYFTNTDMVGIDSDAFANIIEILPEGMLLKLSDY